jgi:hypothetical protein
MTASEVEMIIGEPLRVNPDTESGSEVWNYRVQADPRRDYLIRRIIFDNEMRVKGKVSTYYYE